MSIELRETELSAEVPEVARARPGFRHFLRSWLFLIVGGAIVLAFLVMVAAPGLLIRHPPRQLYAGPPLSPPSADFLLGTDELGRDLFSCIVAGARESLGISVAVVATSAVVGTLIGAIAGFIGGILDDVLMRIVDLFLSLPGFVLAIAIAAVLGRGMTSVAIALVLVWWPGFARLVRGMVLEVKERLHVEAARTLGASNTRILRRHILPFTVPQLTTRVTQDMGYALVSVAGLSFLGLGAQPPATEWGALLNASRAHVVGAWWYSAFPGLAIMLWTLGVSLVGDALVERFGRNDRR